MNNGTFGNPRDPMIEAFLPASGWGDARTAPLAGDASNRRYLRIASDRGDAVLMDAPPDRGEDVRDRFYTENFLKLWPEARVA